MSSDWIRQQTPSVIVEAFGPGSRCWRKSVHDGVLTVLRTMEQHETDGPWVCHLSISHGPQEVGRYPTWDEQKEAVWRFAAGKWMASYLPPQDHPGYINIHETTFHWWETEEDPKR